MKRLTDGIIFPENLYCSCCGDTMEQSRIYGICDSCTARISWITENPLEQVMDEFAFDDLMSCCIYGFFPRRIIYSLKLHRKTYIARGLGRLMAERLTMSEDSYDVMIPVPCTPKKKRKRGFNQAELLAEYIAKALKENDKKAPEVLSGALLKSRETPSMRLSDALTRKSIMDGVFTVPEGKEGLVRGSKVLLVDDVVTTGSTADACAQALKDAGAAKVAVLCFASTASPEERTEFF